MAKLYFVNGRIVYDDNEKLYFVNGRIVQGVTTTGGTSTGTGDLIAQDSVISGTGTVTGGHPSVPWMSFF